MHSRVNESGLYYGSVESVSQLDSLYSKTARKKQINKSLFQKVQQPTRAWYRCSHSFIRLLSLQELIDVMTFPPIVDLFLKKPTCFVMARAALTQQKWK